MGKNLVSIFILHYGLREYCLANSLCMLCKHCLYRWPLHWFQRWIKVSTFLRISCSSTTRNLSQTLRELEINNYMFIHYHPWVHKINSTLHKNVIFTWMYMKFWMRNGIFIWPKKKTLLALESPSKANCGQFLRSNHERSSKNDVLKSNPKFFLKKKNWDLDFSQKTVDYNTWFINKIIRSYFPSKIFSPLNYDF